MLLALVALAVGAGVLLLADAAEAQQAEAVLVSKFGEKAFFATDDFETFTKFPVSSDFRDIAYGEDGTGNDMWIAVRASGMMASSDGYTWTDIWNDPANPAKEDFAADPNDPTTKADNNLWSITYGDGQWMVTTGSWTETCVPLTGTCNAEAWGGIYRSTDGRTWTDLTLPSGAQTKVITNTAWGDTGGPGTWVARMQACYNNYCGGRAVMKSTDGGATWTDPASAPFVSTGEWGRALTYGVDASGNPKWMAGTMTGTMPGNLYTSSDGVTWNIEATGLCSLHGTNVAHDGFDTWVGVSMSGANDYTNPCARRLSDGGGAWTAVSIPAANVYGSTAPAYHPASHTWIIGGDHDNPCCPSYWRHGTLLSRDAGATWIHPTNPPGAASTSNFGIYSVAVRTGPATPADLANTNMTANPRAVPADGMTAANIVVELRDAAAKRTPAHPYYDFDFEVNVTTDLGVFSNGKDYQVLTVSETGDGRFRTTINSTVAGIAHITGEIRDGTEPWTPITDPTFLEVEFFPTPDPAQALITSNRTLVNETLTANITVTTYDYEGNLYVDEDQPVDANHDHGVTIQTTAPGTLTPPSGAATYYGDGKYSAILNCNANATVTLTAKIDYSYNTDPASSIADEVDVDCIDGPILSIVLTTITADEDEVNADGVSNTTVRVMVIGELGDHAAQDGFVVCLKTDLGSFNSTDSTGCPAADYIRTYFNATDGKYILDITSTDPGLANIQGTLEGDAITDTAEVTFIGDAGTPTRLVITSSQADLVSGTVRTLTAQVEDAQGNLITSDNGRSVDFTQASGSGTVTGLCTGATTTAGIATCDVTGYLAGPITIEATDGTLTPGSTTFDVIVGVPNHLSFTSSVADLASGTTRTLTVEVRDAAGNFIASDNGRGVAFTKDGGSGTVTGLCGAASTNNGIATCTVTGDLAGPITLLANDGTLTSASTTFDVIAGTAVDLVFTSSTANLVEGLPRNLVVEVRDGAGNLVESDAGHSVTFTKTGGIGIVTGLCTGQASTNGIATCPTIGDTVGSITIEATATGLTADQTSFTIVASQQPTQYLVTASTNSPVAGAPVTITAQVAAADGSAVGSAGREVTWSKDDGSGSFSAATSNTNSFGVATVTLTTGTVAGTSYHVTATDIDFTGTSGTITTVHGPGDHLFISAQPIGGTSGQALATQPVIQVRDVNGNLATSDGSTAVTATIQSGAGGTLSGTQTVTATGGTITFANLGLSGSVGSYTLRFADTTPGRPAGELVGFVDADPLILTPGTADRLVITSSGADLASGTVRTLSGQVQDATGNLVTSDNGRPIDFIQVSGTGTVTGLCTGATTTAGIATCDVTGYLAGPITIEASAAGLTSALTSFDVVPGAAERLVFTSPTTDLLVDALRTLEVEVLDGAGNLVVTDSGRTVEFAKDAGTGGVTGLCTGASTSNGAATCTVTGASAGPITIEASATGLTAAQSVFEVKAPPSSSTGSTWSTGGTTVTAISPHVDLDPPVTSNRVVARPGEVVTLTGVAPPGSEDGAWVLIESLDHEVIGHIYGVGSLTFIAPSVTPGEELVLRFIAVTRYGHSRSDLVFIDVVVTHAVAPPVADAGQDQVARAGEWVDLDGSLSRAVTGTQLTYLWEQLSGPTVEIVGPSGARAGFTVPDAPQGTALRFALTVVDGHREATNTVEVILVDPSGGPMLPESFRAMHRGAGLMAFQVEVVPGARYVWEFGDGAAGVGAKAVHTYAQGGDHEVRLTIILDDGAASTLRQDVVVPSEPAALASTGHGYWAWLVAGGFFLGVLLMAAAVVAWLWFAGRRGATRARGVAPNVWGA